MSATARYREQAESRSILKITSCIVIIEATINKYSARYIQYIQYDIYNTFDIRSSKSKFNIFPRDGFIYLYYISRVESLEGE